MCKKLVCSLCSVLLLCVLLTSLAAAADPDLAAYWKFDEGSGTTAFDSSGNGNDGTFVGAPQWVAGKFGGALEFNGDDYVNCGNGSSLQIRDQITITFWFQVQAFQNTWEGFLAKGDDSYRASRGGGTGNATHMGISGTSTGGGNGWFNGTVIVTGGDWHHFAATYDGTAGKIYIDGALDVTSPGTGQINNSSYDLYIGENSQATGRFLHGLLDEVRIYSRALDDTEILGVMAGAGAEYPLASAPSPADGATHADTWVTLSWRPGDFAVSHDVYLGETFEDVDAGTGDTFRGNQASTFYVAGFPGFAYPDGLVPGTTYYWRIDEVNDAEPNSPWKGDIWSFSIPPKTAYNPNPADGAEFVATDAKLNWTAGFGAKLHTVYFGDNFDDVDNAVGGAPQGTTTYNPGALQGEKVYYWRVDEFDAVATYKGDVWGFTTPGAAGNPQPANAATGVAMTAKLGWTPATTAVSHDVYFGTDKDTVKNATTASPEYKGNKALGSESYDPGKLAWQSDYYWRVDAVYNSGPVKGLVWSFTTA
ncbi:MAG: LamG domain-containing protein, partial [Planctomycetota bacterium]